ncbi:MAG: hypothetical protein CL678_06615 [Bdellovibrionaceae bacterium]|nr:hypothetical protein [Pseudobdellovibrionaceae bacterium]
MPQNRTSLKSFRNKKKLKIQVVTHIDLCSVIQMKLLKVTNKLTCVIATLVFLDAFCPLGHQKTIPLVDS